MRAVHRWLGLTVGLLFALVSVSGAALFFQPQFFRWAHGDMIPQSMSPTIGSIDSWWKEAREAVPKDLRPIIVWMPGAEHNLSDAGMVVFAGADPGGFGNLGLVAVLVAPDTAEVLGAINFDHSWAYAPVFLHAALWSGRVGYVVTGIIAVGAVALLSLGLYLWWPARGSVIRKLSPRPWRNTLSYASRLHEWSGIWALLVLLLLALTGVHMAKPSWTEPVLALLPAEQAASRVANPTCSAAMSLDVAIERARVLVPGTALTAIRTVGATSVRDLYFNPTGSSAAVRGTVVSADLDCGSVTLRETPDTRSARDAAELWVAGVHEGTAFGTAGRIIVTLAGLVPLLLAWSGVRIWMRRRGWLEPRRPSR